MSYGRGSPIAQKNDIVRNGDSWFSLKPPGKLILPMSAPVPVVMPRNQRIGTWQDLLGMYSEILNYDVAIQTPNPGSVTSINKRDSDLFDVVTQADQHLDRNADAYVQKQNFSNDSAGSCNNRAAEVIGIRTKENYVLSSGQRNNGQISIRRTDSNTCSQVAGNWRELESTSLMLDRQHSLRRTDSNSSTQVASNWTELEATSLMLDRKHPISCSNQRLNSLYTQMGSNTQVRSNWMQHEDTMLFGKQKYPVGSNQRFNEASSLQMHNTVSTSIFSLYKPITYSFSNINSQTQKKILESISTMADSLYSSTNSKKRSGDEFVVPKKHMKHWEFDPAASLAKARHEFGEHGGVNMSIEASATFTVMEPETTGRMFSGELGPDRDFFIYSRHFNPTVLNLSRQIAALEGTEAAYCTASGMSAISSVLLHLVSSGDNIVASQTLYGGTHALLTHFLPRSSGISTTFVDVRDLEKVDEAIVEGKTKVLYFESISNPTLTVANIPELSRIAHRKGVKVIVDNTFAPMCISPVRFGADVVVHSISKFISGGADIIAGAVCGSASLMNSMMDLHQGPLMLLGPTMNAKVAFELAERIPHLGLRMKEHCHRALVFATRMKKLGVRVIYPGLEDHPDHALLKSLINKEYGYGGLLCVDMETEEKSNQLMDILQNSTQFGFMAVSLGYYETLMSCSGSSTSSEMNDEERKLAGISPGLIRMSIGYSGTLEQRWSQLEMAFSRLQDSKN